VAHEAILLRLARLAVDEKQSLERVFARATALIAHTINVERVGIWLFEGARHERLRCACLYVRSADAHRSGELLRPVDFPRYCAALEERRVIVADDARSHPLTRELRAGYLEPHGITSMLDAPLFRHGEVVGVVCHEHVGPPRAWTDAETSFVVSVADLVALVMEQAAYIEARRALEEQTQRAEEERRMAALGRVAAGVGHDFNNLLMIVLARTREILEAAGLPEGAAEQARAILEAARRSRDLTRQLAELGREVEGDYEPLVLDAVVRTSADLLHAMPSAGQRVELAPGADEVQVRFERSRLERVLINLVANALDATAAGGTVRVSTRVVDDPQGLLAVLEVADDGTGIDEEARPHIFEPYFTTKRGRGGSGLGLAIVHAMVARAGGSIAVDSAPGRGTAVTVRLPVVRAG
jgi:signal transduction histidine kinase